MRRVKIPVLNTIMGPWWSSPFRSIFLFSFIAVVMLKFGEPTMLDETINLASYTGKKLIEIAEETTGRKHFQKAFTDLLNEDSIKIEKINGFELVKEFTKELERQVGSKNSVLMKVKKKAEEYYDAEPDNLKPFTFFNMKDYNYSGRPILKVDPKFFASKPVNTSLSGHNIPTNVYIFKPEILNVIKQRQRLDKLYEDNYSKQATLLWQYIGSHSGVLSMYPGYQWGDASQDRYDCRRRGWYATGASSPKDAVILLDRSGSMVGTNWNIAIAAINIIIESLQENDFFNVVQFNSNADVVYDCYQNLVQATKSNKEVILRKIAKLPSPSGFANSMKALEKAYKMLQEARKSELTSSGCHQLIFILSDEIEDFEDTRKIVDRYDTMKVRIFSYQIGQGSKKRQALRYISCKTLGQFYTLQTIGNTYDFVLDYVRTLGNPIALSEKSVSNAPIYVPVYIDWETKLPIFSVVLPLVNNTAGTHSGFLGVAAQDITLIELENTVPVHKLGVYGYGFSINNNGFVLFHHRLSFLKRVNTFSPTTVLDAVEINQKNETDMLTKKMIDRETDSVITSTTQIIAPETKERILESKLSYFFTPVSHTPFTAGIAIQEYGLKQISVGTNLSIDFPAAVKSLNVTAANTKVTISPWPYCNISAKAQQNMPTIYKFYPNKKEIVEYLSKFDEIPSNCDEELTNKLLLSALKTDEIVRREWNYSRNQINHIISTFVSTHSGYTRVQFTGNNHSIGNIGNKSISEIYYLRAATLYKETQLKYIFSGVKPVDKQSDSWVMAVTPIVIGDHDTIAAVAGFSIWQNAIADIIMDKSFKTTNKFLDCSSYSVNGCYIVDSDGYIVAWNSKKHLDNTFFGYSEGLVMRHLVDKGVFTKRKFKDEQAECAPDVKVSGSATRLSNAIFGCLCCLVQSFFTLLTSSFYGFLMSSKNTVQANTTSTRLVYCVKEMTFYKLNESKIPLSGETTDYVCRKSFSLAKIPNTNLLLIVTDRRNAGCNQKDWRLLRDAVKIADKCENKYRYRRQLNNTCSRYHKDEKPHCSSTASQLHTIYALVVTAFALTQIASFTLK